MIWGALASGQMPKGLATSPDNRWLFCSNMGVEGKHTLSVYRSDPLSLDRHLDLPGKAIELAVSADSRQLFVTNSKAWGTLQTFTIDGLTLEREVAVPGFPKWLQLAQGGNTLYTTLWALDGVSRVTWQDDSEQPWQVSTVRTGKGKFSRHASKDKNPRGMALSQDGKTLYVANNADESLSLIDTASFKERSRVRIGYAPRHIVADRQHSLFISLTGNDSVLEFDTRSESAVRELPVGKRPKTIALSHDERFLYVGNFVDNSLTILALPGGERVDLPLDLHKVSGLAMRADDRFLYVTGFCTGDVWAIERIDAGTSPTLPLGSDRDNQPCFTCPSSFEGCPYYEGPR